MARIIVPAALTLVLFAVALFVVVVPTVRLTLLERRREMSQALCETAWSALEHYYEYEKQGVSRAESQQKAIAKLRALRYGEDGKDYFWITDMHPVMIMHPYRPDLEGQDLTDFADQNGKHLFVEFVNVVQDQGAGFVDYMWQWKDDPTRIVPKVSYVKGFEPWGWIVGTGVYLDDVEQEIRSLTGWLVLVCTVIMVIISVLLFYTVLAGLRTESRRRLAEASLQQNLQYLAAVINTTSAGFWLIDGAGRTLDVNESLVKMLDASREDLLATSLLDFADPDSAELIRRSIAQGLNAPVNAEEVTFTRRDGSRLPVLLHATRLPDDQPGQSRVFAFLTDITLRKETELRLQESEERYRRLIETAPVGIVIHRHGRIEFVNHTAVAKLGYETAQQMEGRQISEFLAVESRETAARRIMQVLSSGVSVLAAAVTYIKADGSLLPAEAASAPIIHLGEPAILTVVLDMSERKQAERKLKRLFTAIEQAAEIFLVTDCDYIIQYANPAVEQITGFSAGEVVGSELSGLFELPATGDLFGQIKSTLEQMEVWRGQVRCRTKHNVPCVVEATISPVIDDTGEMTNLVAVMRDVTRESTLEHQLRQVQKLDAIGTLAGGIAHDFNNVLYAIMGYSNMALDEVAPETLAHDYISEVIIAAKRAADLVRQILSFARQSELERAPVAIEPIAREVLKMLRSTLPSVIEIKQHFTSATTTVQADPTELHQIIMNLCTNAAHAMQETGGTLNVAIRVAEIDADFVESHQQLHPGSYVIIAISDTGTGISDEVIERIFEPFFTTKKQGQGTGMGLSVVHGIVLSLNGMITIYTEPGQGTTFNVYLPVASGEEQPAPPADLADLRGTEHILIVDDEESITKMLRQMLLNLGYRVAAFTDSREALAAFARNPGDFAAVVTDQTMPYLTGLELARQMLAIRPELPILIATGFSQNLTPIIAAEAGISAYISKPVFKDELASALRRILEQPRG